MKYPMRLCLLLMVLVSCHKTNKEADSGLRQQWKLTEWDVTGPGTARFYPGADTTIVLNMQANGLYTVQINGQQYSSGSFRVSTIQVNGTGTPVIIFNNAQQLQSGFGLPGQNFYTIGGGTLTLRSADENPGFQYSSFFQVIH